MKKLLLGAFVLLLLPLRADAQCVGMQIYPPPYGTVCGAVWKPGHIAPATSYNVKFCRPGNNDPYTCRALTTYLAYNSSNQPAQAFIYYNWGGSSTTYVDWDVYVWSNDEYYGSATAPINRVWISGNGGSGLSYTVPPRPLPPTPIHPGHGSTVGSAYTVVWYSGIDFSRTGRPATWAIWFKYWPFGTAEPAAFTLARDNMPCHDDGSGPDSQGRCSTYVAGPQPAGNWKWKVVAKLDVTNMVPYYMGPTYFETESGVAAFTGY